MLGYLVEGDERQAPLLVGELARRGLSMATIAHELLVPALRDIGEEWRAGRLEVAVEHRASAIVERIVGDHYPRPRGRRRGMAVIAALSGDRHVFRQLWRRSPCERTTGTCSISALICRPMADELLRPRARRSRGAHGNRGRAARTLHTSCSSAGATRSANPRGWSGPDLGRATASRPEYRCLHSKKLSAGARAS